MVVFSITFALGHILNLVNGSGKALAENLVQIVSVVLIGFLFLIIFLRGGSLWSCVISHGVFNSLSAFPAKDEPVCLVVILCVIVAYALVLMKVLPKKENGSV